LQTQWRYSGMGGATGLDYAGVLAYLREVAGVKASDRAALFASLQAMEIAALNVWAEKRE
jgi:hypothetical protein